MARLRIVSGYGFFGLAILAAIALAVSPPLGLNDSHSPLQAAEGEPEQSSDGDSAQEAAAGQKFYTALEQDVTQGALRFKGDQGQVVECPLKHTDVKAEVSGFIARVNVTQTFHNPTQEKIEAVYVFPLPHEAAVDNMTMVLGDRKIVGIIKRREEARRIYEAALAQGQTAALLEQERPNIFTQSVGNIAPGQEVKIEISYVDVLRYDMGTYEFSFPMVVGPRYNPGAPLASPQPRPAELQGKVSPPAADTTRVPDASRISPPVLKPGVRNGHDISLTVSLEAGVPVQNLTVPNHQSDVKRDGQSRAQITLSPADSVPNKDFVLRYDVVGEKPAMAVLAHTGKYSPDATRLGEGYFMVMIQPQEDERLKQSPPREIVFLCDISGSMSGEPTAKVREAMDHMLRLCREGQDTVQVVTFAGQANKLFEKPVPVTKENIQKALNFAQQFEGSGGTEMLKGVQMAIDEPVDKERVRIVVMLTDGYIGNEAEIIEHVGKNCGDRVRFWAIGIGSSPNMFLVDGVAKQGGGMGKKLGLEDDAMTLSQEVMARIQRAQLANVKIDWGGLQAAETYPARIPELWAGRPIIVYGRYQNGGEATITVRGDMEGQPAEWPLEVTLPKEQPQHDVLAKVWARQKIEDLMQQDFYQNSPAVEETVTALALDYKLMSQFTSLVAVDAQSETTSDAPRPPRRMLVPVPLPEGTRWEGFFGELKEAEEAAGLDALQLGREVLRRKSFLAGGAAGAAGYGAFGGDRRLAERQLFRGRALQSAPQHYFALVNSPTPALAKLSVASADFFSPNGRYAASAAEKSLMQVGQSYNRFGGFAYGLGARTEAGKELARGGRASLLYESLALADKKDGAVAVDYEFTGAALVGEAAPLAQDAAAAWEEGQKLHKEGKQQEARAALLKAYFLDSAAANFGASAGQIAAAALALLEEIRHAQWEAWAKETPQLEKQLDLVIRDQSLSEALGLLSRTAGVELRTAPGSLSDAAELLNQEELRVGFLDLRGATLAQALDWTLRPVRLDWSVRDGAIQVQTIRRMAGAAPWVYDVSLLALPSPEEINKEQDHQKRIEAAKQFADAFLQAVRAELPGEGVRVEWFAPGQLVVIGEPKTHQRAAAVLALLADDKAKGQLAPAAAKLRPQTAGRAKDRQDDLARAREANQQLEVVLTHDAYAWQLLAAAADGRLDLEAITELQIAWGRPEMAKLLQAKAPGVLIRSWWAIAESARALPQEEELQTLAAKAKEAAHPAAERMLKTLQDAPGDLQAALTVLYAALAADENAPFRDRAAAALGNIQGDDPSIAHVRVLAAALLQEDVKPIDRAALAELAPSGVEGNDLVALTALACRRAGGEAWQAFRRQRRDLVGDQPLAGDVIVLANRLAASYLPLAQPVR